MGIGGVTFEQTAQSGGLQVSQWAEKGHRLGPGPLGRGPGAETWVCGLCWDTQEEAQALTGAQGQSGQSLVPRKLKRAFKGRLGVLWGFTSLFRK